MSRMTETALSEPAFLVLTALTEQPLHGYAVIEDVKRISHGEVTLHTGTLYALLDRLRTAGLIEVDREEVVASRLRRYYRLTGLGQERLAREVDRMKRLATAAGSRLARLRLKPGAGAA